MSSELLYRCLSAPISVQVELTARCPNRCVHCYNHWRKQTERFLLHKVLLSSSQLSQRRYAGECPWHQSSLPLKTQIIINCRKRHGSHELHYRDDDIYGKLQKPQESGIRASWRFVEQARYLAA